MKKFFTACFGFWGTLAVGANPYYIDNQLIVKLEGSAASYGLRSQVFTRSDLAGAEPLVPELGLYLVRTRQSGYSALMSTGRDLTRQTGVRYVAPDYRVRLRNSPNDPDFHKQWSLNGQSPGGIKALEAWGLLKEVRRLRPRAVSDVVVAVVDDGVDITHPDLRENLWVNAGEIPNNGKDDDGNGFVDDVYGWNAYDDNGNLRNGIHGTHVAGIVAARGNNRQHVAGVNWEARVMVINGSSGSTSVVSKAYGYALRQKKLWLSSGGKQGANVVVTNSSFGIDGADCNQAAHQIWNDLYNSMGEAGILSAVATTNSSTNVDTQGDVPSGCPSPYLIAVTNTMKDDRQHPSSGYGARSIDLGAPGTAIVSTVPGNATQEFTGTSMATPHVAGAIGFLHALGSQRFQSTAVRSPGQAALAVKQIVLSTVDKNESLRGRTVTGGRLNLFEAAKAMAKH